MVLILQVHSPAKINDTAGDSVKREYFAFDLVMNLNRLVGFPAKHFNHCTRANRGTHLPGHFLGLHAFFQSGPDPVLLCALVKYENSFFLIRVLN